MTNLDLAALIRCLEVMADENSWDVNKDTYMNTLINPIEARPWEVAKEALKLVSAVSVGMRWNDTPYGHDRISNQEFRPVPVDEIWKGDE